MLLALLLVAASAGSFLATSRPAVADIRHSVAGAGKADIANLVRADRVIARVMDEARILPRATADRIAAASASLERRTGHQYVVVTEPSLRGLTVQRFSLALFNGLRVGRACCNDGVGLLIAPNERKARIEVGKGLERALTEREAKRIMDRVMVPRFRRGDYAGGGGAGTRAIIAEIDA